MSNAVDRVISEMNFEPLAGQTVYLDDQYVTAVKGIGFVNAPYVISSIRQQLTAAGCLIQDKEEDADVIVEPRVGSLGTDGHEVTFGIPPSNAISSAASVVANAPAIPVLPEVSLAKSDSQSGAAKIGCFAYYRESKQPIWQSGTLVAKSTANDTWFLGAGPLQYGTIHDGVRFAGGKIGFGKKKNKRKALDHGLPRYAYNDEVLFSHPRSLRLASKPEESEKKPPVTKAK